MTAIDAIAESWASIDGKLDKYEAERDGKGSQMDGHYEGYQAEAKEMLKRVESRGYALIKTSVLDKALLAMDMARRL